MQFGREYRHHSVENDFEFRGAALCTSIKQITHKSLVLLCEAHAQRTRAGFPPKISSSVWYTDAPKVLTSRAYTTYADVWYTNATVRRINKIATEQFPGQIVKYYCADSVMGNEHQQATVPIDFFISLALAC